MISAVVFLINLTVFLKAVHIYLSLYNSNKFVVPDQSFYTLISYRMNELIRSHQVHNTTARCVL